jgi:hypothetical protein
MQRFVLVRWSYSSTSGDRSAPLANFISQRLRKFFLTFFSRFPTLPGDKAVKAGVPAKADRGVLCLVRSQPSWTAR